ncbi:hypothetical protein F4678DRAFT_466485 [Xylaria arbuscula]|nr:hypothetical protein F4678DRAFT_466485 [Xylaria arbuscula]
MSMPQSTVPQPPEGAATCAFSPVKDNPEAAEKFVRKIAKHKPRNTIFVSIKFAPLFGFGPHSEQSALARCRAHSVFASPIISEPLTEFISQYTRDKWGLPVAKFPLTLAIVRNHRNEENWTNPKYPAPECGNPERHYARFIIRILNSLESPLAQGAYLLKWLSDTRAGREDEWVQDVCWIYFHVILYLQLNVMDMNKRSVPFSERARRYLKTRSESISRVFLARKGVSEVRRRHSWHENE